MKSFWFGGKVALLFVLFLALALGGALLLFLRIAAPELAREIGRLRAYDAIAVVESVERLWPTIGGRFDDPQVVEVLRREETARNLRLSLAESMPERHRHRHHHDSWWTGDHGHVGHFEVGGRQLWLTAGPGFDLWTPVRVGGRTVAHLRLSGPDHAVLVHRAFERGLLRIAVLTLIGVVVLTVVLTAPLRRMSRSMDRVAAGELDHRVVVRGRDEVAAMGTSFNAMADRIQEMILGQKEMLAGVSHELRSPLARMKVTLELMRDAATVDGERDRERHLASLEEEVDHIDGLVGEILTASRLDLGTAPLRREIVALDEVAAGAWERSAATLPDEAAPSLHVEVRGESDGCRVSADPDLVWRVFENLLANARRYARDRVDVSIERRDTLVEVEISDDGPGVDGPYERLFEPFYRADPARSHGRHVGLGLAIVRRAVEAHGGRVEARRAESGGLAIRFELPAAS